MNSLTCFRCQDGLTPLYCLNCAGVLLKAQVASAESRAERLAALVEEALIHAKLVAAALNSNDPKHSPPRGSIGVVAHALTVRDLLEIALNAYKGAQLGRKT